MLCILNIASLHGMDNSEADFSSIPQEVAPQTPQAPANKPNAISSFFSKLLGTKKPLAQQLQLNPVYIDISHVVNEGNPGDTVEVQLRVTKSATQEVTASTPITLKIIDSPEYGRCTARILNDPSDTKAINE